MTNRMQALMGRVRQAPETTRADQTTLAGALRSIGTAKSAAAASIDVDRRAAVREEKLTRHSYTSLDPSLEQLLANPTIQKYLRMGGSTNNVKINNLNELFQQHSEIAKEILEDTTPEAIVSEAREIITAFWTSLSGTARFLAVPPAEILATFFSLPSTEEGRTDLSKFVDHELNKTDDPGSCFRKILTVLKAAELISQPQPASSKTSVIIGGPIIPAEVTPVDPTTTEALPARAINPDLRSSIVRGSLMNYPRIPAQHRTIINSILTSQHPQEIVERLEAAIRAATQMLPSDITLEAERLIKSVRQDESSSPEGIRDTSELLDRTIRRVQAEIDAWTTPQKSDLPLLEEKFRQAIVIMSYYYPAA